MQVLHGNDQVTTVGDISITVMSHKSLRLTTRLRFNNQFGLTVTKTLRSALCALCQSNPPLNPHQKWLSCLIALFVENLIVDSHHKGKLILTFCASFLLLAGKTLFKDSPTNYRWFGGSWSSHGVTGMVSYRLVRCFHGQHLIVYIFCKLLLNVNVQLTDWYI